MMDVPGRLERERLGRWVVASAALAAACLATAFVARVFREPPYDDAFITFRYAANLRDGLGLVFNPGDRFLSATTPLFTILLGVLGALLRGVDVVTLGYWTSLLFLAAAGLVAASICLAEGEPIAAAAAPATVVLAPTLAATVGQEMALFVLLGFLAFLLWQRRRLAWAAACLGLLTVTRPDGALLGLMLLAAELARTRQLPWRAGAVFALVTLPWLGYAWLNYGSILPFPLTAKVAQAETGWWTKTDTALLVLLRGLWERNPAYLALVGIGVLTALARRRWVLLLAFWQCGQAAAYVALGVAHYPWYLAPFHAVLGLFAALGLGSVVRLGAARLPRSALREAVGPVVALGVAGLLVLPEASSIRAFGRTIPDPGMRQYEQIAAWVRTHTGPASVVAALEMGRLGYGAQRQMFDFVGLVRPPIVEHLRQKDLIWSVQTYLPDYVIAIPPDRWLLEDRWFQSSYTPLRSFVDPAVYAGQPTTLFIRNVGSSPDVPVVPHTHTFGTGLELVGYTPLAADDRNDVLRLVSFWVANGPVDRNYTLFVHALDAQGKLVGQADGQPARGERPTTGWVAGQTVVDVRDVPVPPGTVRLQVGWYLLETLQRLPGRTATGLASEVAEITLPGRPAS